MELKNICLQTSQQGLARTSKDLRRYQTEARDLEVKVGQLTQELQTATAGLEKQTRENQDLKDQVSSGSCHRSSRW